MKYFILSMISLASHFAMAGLFAEPFVGYNSATIKLTDLLTTTTEIKASQPSFGLKLGFRSPIGIDINLAGETTSGQASVSSLVEKNKFTHNSASVQLGVNSLGLVKMYLGSSFLNDFTLDDSSSLQGFKLSGTAFQAGLQFKFFPYMNLGVQCNLNQFSIITGPAYGTDSKVETYYIKTDAQDYSIYLSTSF